jgi:hypothetical protein
MTWRGMYVREAEADAVRCSAAVLRLAGGPARTTQRSWAMRIVHGVHIIWRRVSFPLACCWVMSVGGALHKRFVAHTPFLLSFDARPFLARLAGSDFYAFV